MPTYEYACSSCRHEFEELQKITAAPLTTCPVCTEETLKRKFGGGSGLMFAGSGYYCTDYPSASPKACCPCGKTKNSCSDT